MKKQVFFNTSTFLLLFAVVLFAVCVSFRAMHTYIGQLDRLHPPTAAPAAKVMAVAEL